MKLRLIEQLEHRARINSDTIAVRQVDGLGMTWGELAAQVETLSAHLASYAAPGGVVLISSPNQPEFIVAFLASLAAGLRAFPGFPELAAPEILSAAERSDARVAIATSGILLMLYGRVDRRIPIESVADVPRVARFDRSHDASGLLLLSSGTTGRPKIVFRDARSLDAVSEAMATAIGFTESDRVLACVPLCHSYGLEHGLLAPLWAGCCVSLARGFELRRVLRELVESRITIFPGVPFMFEMLAQHGRDAAGFPALRRAYSAGGPLPKSVADAFRTAFGVTVSQLYGATEIGSVTYADPDLPGFDPASVGRAMTGVSIRILDPDTEGQGHVAVAAGSMLTHYLGEESTPTTDGYFLTGDLGRLDGFGNLTITGRIKLLIDVGGLKVNPVEIEEVLMQHPNVASCVVVPVHVSETVSRIKAIVTPASEQPSAESLRQFVRERLAGYKVPRVFEVRDSLPKSPTGKILRHLVEA